MFSCEFYENFSQNIYGRLLVEEKNLAENLREFPVLSDKSASGYKGDFTLDGM